MRCDMCGVLIDDSVSYVYVSYAGMNICTDCAVGEMKEETKDETLDVFILLGSMFIACGISYLILFLN